MLRKISLYLGTFATASIPLFLSTSQINSQIMYNDLIFNSEEELFNYYVSQNPDAINTKMVIGDIDQAITDYDYGLLDFKKFESYDGAKLLPAYVKNNGDLTSSIIEAKKSYANPALIKEYYQGPDQNLYDDQAIAKQAIIDDFLVFDQGFYTLPGFTNAQDSITYNPLNSQDYNLLTNSLLSALQSQETQFNTQDYQKIIANADTLPSLVAYTDYAKFDNRSLTNPPLPTPETIMLDSLNMSLFKPINGVKKINDTDGKINPLAIKVFPFPQALKSDNQFWTLSTPAITNLTSGDDSTYTNVAIEQNNTITISDNYVIDQFLANKDMATIDVEIKTMPLAGDVNPSVYLAQFDLSRSAFWLDFVTQATSKINKIKRNYGSAIDYQLVINFDQENSLLFNHYFEDGPSTNDFHYLSGLNPESLDIRLEITDQLDPNHVLVNITDHFLSYYNQKVNIDGKNWNKNLLTLFAEFAADPHWINSYGNWYKPTISPEDYLTWKAMTDQILHENISFLKAWSEVITLKNNDYEEQIPLFSLKRNWDSSLNYGNVNLLKTVSQLDLAQLKNAFWAKINPIGSLNNIYVNNYLLKDIIDDFLEDIIYDHYWIPTKVPLEDIYLALANLDVEVQNLIFANLATNNSNLTILDPLLAHMQNIIKYLQYQKNHGQVIDFNFINNDLLMQQREIDFDKLLTFIPNTESLNQNGQTNQNLASIGEYLVLDINKFNFSCLENDVNKPLLFTNGQELNQYRNNVVAQKPKVVRVLYDLDGNIIWGNLNNNFVYDPIPIILINVTNQIEVKIDPNYLFYQNNNNLKLISNHWVRIYTWTIINAQNQKEVLYFLNHDSLQKYIIDQLLLNALIIN